MSSPHIERRLAAILSADIVGYSRLMGNDDEGTLQLRDQYFALISELASRNDGRAFGAAGDSVMAEFASASSAVRCAVEIQQHIQRINLDLPADHRMYLRIGVNLGDAIIEGENLYGDGVNMAARLQELAQPGSVAVSGEVYRQVRSRLDFDFKDHGTHKVKNIDEPVRIYEICIAAVNATARPPKTGSAYLAYTIAGLAILILAASALFFFFPSGSGTIESIPSTPLEKSATPNRTGAPAAYQASIAVMPFVNLSGDIAQEYFSDGITDDLITDLSRVSNLSVASRSAVFMFKEGDIGVVSIGRELGVRYVLEGTVRKIGDRVRISAKLTDVETGFHVWADRYDRDYRDVLKLQDDVVTNIVRVLKLRLTEADRRTLAKKYARDVEAYDYFLRGLDYFHRGDIKDNARARDYYEQAIAIDPEFARAIANLAWTHARDFANAWAEDADHALADADRLVEQALKVDAESPHINWIAGAIKLFRNEHDSAMHFAERVLELNPNFSDGDILLARVLHFSGRPRESVEVIETAIERNPRHPAPYLFNLGEAAYTMQDYDTAITALRTGLGRNPGWERAHMWLAASLAQVGNRDEAEWEAQEILVTNPNFSISAIERVVPFKDPQQLEHLLEGLRKAGFPES